MKNEITLLKERQEGFLDFYKALIPTLVEFVGLMGVQPSHEVLKHAVRIAPYLDKSLKDMLIGGGEERTWLLLRMGQFIGEYFVQKYDGCWYVNDIVGSRYFARYVVGQFAALGNKMPMLDPFLIAQGFVDAPVPRNLEALLREIDVELIQVAKGSSSGSDVN